MKQTALVTGASNGIGYELAKLLAKDGYNLVLVARSESKLQQLAQDLHAQHGVAVKVIAKDLGLATAPEEIFAELQAAQVHVDLLVNNAGYGMYGNFAESELSEQLGMIQLNITALTHLTHLFLPGMIAKRQGRIMNVASTAAFQPGPLMAVYYATKAFVLSFSEALANEVQAQGITVSAFCPGPTSTGFGERAQLGQSKLFDAGVMDAASVARIGYAGWLKGQTVIVPGVRNQMLASSVRFMPRKTVVNIVRKIQDKR
ncbi:MAG: SDR family NAD(P)-dependent oxidoreductase [Tumebacillaceae bacterium]